eukprot:scaffold1469_cov119-Cylindrotheca_fusiformis.AAC.24
MTDGGGNLTPPILSAAPHFCRSQIYSAVHTAADPGIVVFNAPTNQQPPAALPNSLINKQSSQFCNSTTTMAGNENVSLPLCEPDNEEVVPRHVYVRQLIGFTCAELSENSSASSQAIPAPTAPTSDDKRERRKRKKARAAAQAKPAKKFRRKVMKIVTKLSSDMNLERMRNRLEETEVAMQAYLEEKNISTDDEDEDGFIPSLKLRKLREDVAFIEAQIEKAERQRQRREPSASEDSDSGSDGSINS